MKKQPIIFVHGAWHGKWCWDKYFRQIFEAKDYEVITFSLPGHDKPGKVKGINKYRISDYTNALVQEVEKVEELPIIIGHSMGGLVVQKYLEKHDCKKAVLMASVPPTGVLRTTIRFMKKPYFYPSLLGLNLYGLVNSESKSTDAFFSDDLPLSNREAFANQLCSESFLAFLNMLLPGVKIKKDYAIPTLVIGAENDKIFSVQENQYTAKKYDADLIVMKDVAHDMMLDTKYLEVAEKILSWIDK